MVATSADSGWRTGASCRQADPELFFSDQPAAQTTALATCAACPVVKACLRDALQNPRLYGVWGGRTETERREMLGLKPRKRPRAERSELPRPVQPPRVDVRPSRRPGLRLACGCGAESCPREVSVWTRRRHWKAAGLSPAVVHSSASPVDCRCGLSTCRGMVSRRTRWRHQRQVAEMAQVAA